MARRESANRDKNVDGQSRMTVTNLNCFLPTLEAHQYLTQTSKSSRPNTVRQTTPENIWAASMWTKTRI
jgi:hypothetical protein